MKKQNIITKENTVYNKFTIHVKNNFSFNYKRDTVYSRSVNRQ